MPTNKRRLSRKFEPEGLTSDQREHLLTGRNLLSGDHPFRSESHRKRLYFRHRAELLAETGPDKRPAAWWTFSAPEKKRRIISGDPKKCLWDKGLFFGMSKFWEVADGFFHYEDPDRPVYESQRDYLIRHGLYSEET